MSVLGRSRTGDLPFRARLLYPMSYGDLNCAQFHIWDWQNSTINGTVLP